MNRRLLLRAGMASAVGAALPLAGCGGEADTVELTVSSLADGVHLIAGAGSNVVALRGPNGAVIVDGGLAKHADTLTRTIARAVGTRDVQTLFNTHWHREQTGLNESLGRAGVPIVAHENTRLWLSTDVTRPWEPDVTFAPLPEFARPSRTIYDRGELDLGDERIAYGYLHQAHTDGDIYVFLREANVLCAGGVVSGAGWAPPDWWTGGWIGSSNATLNANLVTVAGGMVGGLTQLAALADDDTKIVPADGRVLSKTELQAQIAMYSDLAGQLRDMLFRSFGPEDVLAAEPAKAYVAEMGDPDLFLTLAFQSLWGHFAPDA